MRELSDEEKLPKSWRTVEVKDVLAEAVHRLGLPYSREHIRSMFAAGSSGDTARALIEHARALGLGVEAGEIDAAQLESPEAGVMIVGGLVKRGYGLIEAVTPEHVTVWDPVYKSRRVTRAEFSAMFSGLVAVIERPDGYRPPVRERGRLARRVVEYLWEELRLPTELAGAKASNVAGPVLLAALLAMLGVAATRGAPLIVGVLGVSAMVGLLLSYAMIRSVYGGTKSVDILCGGEHSGCNDLLRSRYARIAGIPASGLGLAFFTAQLLVLTCFSSGPFLTGALTVATVPESVLFFWVMLRNRTFCRLCAVIHAVNFASAAVFVAFLATSMPPFPELILQGAVWVFAFALVLSGVVPHLVGADKAAIFEAELEDLRESPWWLGREMAKSAPLPFDVEPLTVPITHGKGEFNLWVVANPECPTCSVMMKAFESWLARDQGTRLRGRIGFTKSFNPSASEAILAVTLATEGRRMFEAYRYVRARVLELNEAQVDLFPEVATALGLPLAELESHRSRASALAIESDARCRDLTPSGFCITPLLIFAGRRLYSSLAVIESLLDQNPELLKIALRSNESRRP